MISSYPVLMSSDVTGSADYYRNAFGYETTFESDWYVSLRRGQWELALLDHAHTTIPAGYGRPAGGVLINVEVDDVDSEYQRLIVREGFPMAQDIRSEDFGQRHFILVGPDQVLIDVIQPIEPSGEFSAQYVQS